MTPFDELFALAHRLEEASRAAALDEANAGLRGLDEVVSLAARAFSGSWLGYHARVYYKDLQSPPAGAHFSQEWGLNDMSYTSLGSRGEWMEYDVSV